MRGYDRPQTTMLTLVNRRNRPANHPIRLIKALAELFTAHDTDSTRRNVFR
jgi:hypothetical protein